jgi:hypothetical protein
MHDLYSLIQTILVSHPEIGSLILVLGSIGWAFYLKHKYHTQEKTLTHKIYTDMAHLYADALRDTNTLAEEIRKSRHDLRGLSRKARRMEHFLEEVQITLEKWSNDYPPSLEEIHKIINQFKDKE